MKQRGAMADWFNGEVDAGRFGRARESADCMRRELERVKSTPAGPLALGSRAGAPGSELPGHDRTVPAGRVNLWAGQSAGVGSFATDCGAIRRSNQSFRESLARIGRQRPLEAA
jgi:hypothetical protein